MTQYLFEIGTTVSTTNLESLSTKVIPPKSTFTPYTSVQTMDDGHDVGIGAPTASWKWTELFQTHRDMLRKFCPGASATVFIRTYTKDNAMAPRRYQAVMHWPVMTEETDTGRRMDFEIKFTDLVTPTAVFTALVNGSPAVGSTSIPYDGSSGSVSAGQTCLVGTAAGLSDEGVVLTVSAGAGTMVVAANSIVWADNHFLTVVP